MRQTKIRSEKILTPLLFMSAPLPAVNEGEHRDYTRDGYHKINDCKDVSNHLRGVLKEEVWVYGEYERK